MKRFHVHVAVDDLSQSIGFYSNLFAAEPVVLKDDYAKWMLDDPSVNFAISTRAGAPGVDHLGIQVETGDELGELAGRLEAAGEVTRDRVATTCCYAKADKAWVNDPSGLLWETFHTFGEATDYGEDEPGAARAIKSEVACCSPGEAPAAPSRAACC
jgi:catechol 2,3-dioxygenase-like lactoylglutathione lyase family enzyme